ncbi:MAG: VWA domain-containing protein [Lachnospiraceae bacterium]|nr:VWA domain-containing protein [Lachnospiraceae bacterium]
MIINPIIPIWLMVIVCILFLCVKRKGKASYIRQILIVILLFVINMRIMVRGGDVPTMMPNVDIVFVVDNTLSILAEDYGDNNGRRIDAIKEDCKYITEQFPGASFSVIAFGNNVQQMIPYTTDATMTVETIGTLHGGSQYHANGTSLNAVMESMQKMLDDKRGNYKILFFISDGEIQSSDPLKSYSGLNKLIDSGAVLGYGTEKGGPMKPVEYYIEESEWEYLTYYDDNFDKQKALSKIDEKNLKSIASDFGVEYIHMTSQSEIHSTIKDLQNKISKIEPTKNMDSKEGYEDTYFWFVIPLLLLLVIDFICTKKRM